MDNTKAAPQDAAGAEAVARLCGGALSQDDQMTEITMIGTAATMPLEARALSSAFLMLSGRGILFDCGEGTQASARKCGVNLMRTDVIAITHCHGDHIFGLPGLLQSFGCLGRTADLTLCGPEGFENDMKSVLQLAGPLPYRVLLKEMPDGSCLTLKALNPAWPDAACLTAFDTVHRVRSCGYTFRLPRSGRFDAEAADALGVPPQMRSRLQKGESVTLEDGAVITPEMVLGPPREETRIVFTGDTAPCSAIIQQAAHADLLICDATYGSDEYLLQAEKYGHCTYSQAARMAAEAEVKRLWLTHYSQIMEEPEEFLGAAAAICPEAHCAQDGDRLQLAFSKR